MDENGNPVDVPGYADIVQVEVESDGDYWLFTIETRSTLTWRDPIDEPLWLGFILDTNRDGHPEYHLSLENDVERGKWYGGLFDVEETYFYSEHDFPGTAVATGSRALIRIDAGAIGDPSVLQAAATIERQVWTDNLFVRNESYDTAPNFQWPEDDPDWILIRRR